MFGRETDLRVYVEHGWDSSEEPPLEGKGEIKEEMGTDRKSRPGDKRILMKIESSRPRTAKGGRK